MSDARGPNRIRLLSEQAANQIAAGEVIERPASVVKELVENALDAGAERITVEIQAGGRSLIRVTDDGAGMSRDDALLSLERHATSKIRKAEDLAFIRTMGFRGEALPSIASVSRFTLTTLARDGDRPDATQIIVHGGRIQSVREAGHAPGTTVEVRRLFFNLPARRKFLRTEETERTHVQHYLILVAMAHPEVGFTYVQDRRTLWQLPPVPTRGRSRLDALRDRMQAMPGSEKKLTPVEFETVLVNRFRSTIDTDEPGESDDETGPEHDPDHPNRPDPADRFVLWGFIGAPGVSRGNRGDQHLFVNRRPIDNRGLNFALLEGYHTSLMKGRYPVCCLFIEIDPATVDVNIHPSKREVKFRDEAAVRRLVSRAVREALLMFHRTSSDPHSTAVPASGSGDSPLSAPPSANNTANRSTAGAVDTPNQPATDGDPLELRPADPQPPESVPVEMTELLRPAGWIRPGNTGLEGPPTRSGPAPADAAEANANANPDADAGASAAPSIEIDPREAQPVGGAAPASTPLQVTAPGGLRPAGGSPTPLLAVPLRIVGVVGKLYVVLESDRGLVLLDQHAAHERILYEQLLQRMEMNEAPSQRLLLPETVELSPRDAAFVRELLPSFSRMGVGLSEFGDRTFLLDALPPFVKAADARRFVIELIDELKASGADVNSLRLGEPTVAKTVCRHAVKANDTLRGPELEKLLADLRRCSMPYTCPHGRPTLIEMNFRELEKKFGRSA